MISSLSNELEHIKLQQLKLEYSADYYCQNKCTIDFFFKKNE